MGSRWVFLSYMVSDQLTAYRNGRRIETELVSSIARGDVSNHTAAWVSLHFGTHIDFPRHFLADGKTSNDYGPDFFVMEKILVVCPDKLANPYLLSSLDLETFIQNAPTDTQCILVKTGMGSFRMKDCYWNDSIGIDTGVAESLRSRFPELRFFGFDFMSVSGSHYRELGRQVHHELLGRGILPIEDMNLEPLDHKSKIDKLIVSPYRVNESDAAPVTVFGSIY